ncbi:sce7726 family protein [Deinococcus multiflagellatus]|uniref:Sce7726 family protein n=1 Tax=Deinococcus multiflagellatus TaxID=1656887 RepID=A0ABW1ZEX1_9DEIO|nr:sce7726 family protein [Deinococcus multiflagellatus]MBZ9712210.1 sce7726 family protein [Deinococcus multiflagellatus]
MSVTWLCGNPRHYGRTRIEAPDRDTAAQTYAGKTLGPEATISYVGQGWYDATFPGYNGGPPHTYAKRFRVAKAPAQARRGVDEGAARRALMGLHRAGWAVTEAALRTPPRGERHEEGRADLLVLPDDEGSIGYEIKTDRDTLHRLPRQVRGYDRTFGRRVLATTPRHLDAALPLLPQAWGVVLLDSATHEVREWVREPQEGAGEAIRAGLLTGELWSTELNALLRDIGHVRNRSLTNDRRLEILRRHYNTAALLELTFRTLAARQGTRVTAVRLDGDR